MAAREQGACGTGCAEQFGVHGFQGRPGQLSAFRHRPQAKTDGAPEHVLRSAAAAAGHPYFVDLVIFLDAGLEVDLH